MCNTCATINIDGVTVTADSGIGMFSFVAAIDNPRALAAEQAIATPDGQDFVLGDVAFVVVSTSRDVLAQSTKVILRERAFVRRMFGPL